jgi:hypothetical protein
VTDSPRFDPYALFDALERERIYYVVVGGFARIVHGSAERTSGLDIAPSLREENLRRLGRVLEELDATAPDGAPVAVETLLAGEPLHVQTAAGELKVVPTPWGTRGYDEIRIRANRENLGRAVRPSIASVVDLTRMLEASHRPEDAERLHRLRRMMELEHELTRSHRLSRGLDRGMDI